LNQLVLDVMVSGHHHRLMPITTDIPANETLYYHTNYWPTRADEPMGYRTDSDFNTFVVSRRVEVADPLIDENLFGNAFTGLATTVEFLEGGAGTITARYTNQLGQIVPIISPFTGIEYAQIIIPTTTWNSTI